MDRFPKYCSYVARHWVLFGLLQLFLFSGCAIRDFFSQRYENSVAYFNTYYNASRLYDEAILEIENTEKLQKSRGLPPQKEVSPTVRQKLTTVIEKCARLLLYYPESKWVDDALLLMGKSYYYLGEYPKAERKFTELMTEFPTSNELLEAQLWLGKALQRSDDYDRATRELGIVVEKSLTEDEEEIAAEAFMTLGEIYAGRRSYDEAIDAYRNLIERADYDDLKPKAQFRIGEMHEAKREHQKAASAFLKVLEYKPDKYLGYLARSRYAANLRETAQYDESLRVFYDLLDERDNSVFFPLIKLEIANTLNHKGDIEGSIEAYEIIDTLYAKTDAAARALYQLGLIYEKQMGNYAAAETNYVKSKSEFPPSEVVPLATRRSDNLRRYSLFRDLIWRYDSLLAREVTIPAPPGDTTASVVEDSVAENPEETIRGEDDRKLHFELWGMDNQSQTITSVKLMLARQTYDLATLFLLELEEPDSALFWCEKTLILSSDSELSSRALYTLAEIHRARNPEDQAILDSLYERIVADYPATLYAEEARRTLGMSLETEDDPAASLYAEAEILLKNKEPAEAIALFQKLIKDYPESEYLPRTHYAIGWIYENVEGQIDSATAHYRILTELYPSSKFASAVRPKLTEVDLRLTEEKAHADSASGVPTLETDVPADTVQVKDTRPLDELVEPDVEQARERVMRKRQLTEDEVDAIERGAVDTSRVRKE